MLCFPPKNRHLRHGKRFTYLPKQVGSLVYWLRCLPFTPELALVPHSSIQIPKKQNVSSLGHPLVMIQYFKSCDWRTVVYPTRKLSWHSLAYMHTGGLLWSDVSRPGQCTLLFQGRANVIWCFKAGPMYSVVSRPGQCNLMFQGRANVIWCFKAGPM